MTVRRVSRRRRRHLRKTRSQRGGDRTPQDANEWAKYISEIYDPANSIFRDHNNEFMIDKLAGYASINRGMHITINNQEYSLIEVAARVAVFMFNFINKEEHTYTSYEAWFTKLDSDDLAEGYKKTLLDIENALRRLAQVPTLQEEDTDDIGRSANYPLYVWALVFSIPSKSASEAAEKLVPALFPEVVVNALTDTKDSAITEGTPSSSAYTSSTPASQGESGL